MFTPEAGDVTGGDPMILATSRERIGLLRAGFSDSEIEKLYVILNFFEIVNVAWVR